MQEALSIRPQPDAVAPSVTPSLWLYAAIALLAIGLAGFAFFLLGKVDWPSLLLNVSAGLLSALVVLVVVERRIRQSELTALKQAPQRAQLSFYALVSPSTRAARSYARFHLAALEPLLISRFPVPALDLLEPRLLQGCNLLAGPGMGKTTWLQSVAAKKARKSLASNGAERSVVLYPLRRWRSGLALEDAIIDHIREFASCSRPTARKFLARRISTLFLDGYDEIFMKEHSFHSDLNVLRAVYPGLAITIASRPNYPNPMPNVEIVEMPGLGDEEITEIRRRLRSGRDDA